MTPSEAGKLGYTKTRQLLDQKRAEQRQAARAKYEVGTALPVLWRANSL